MKDMKRIKNEMREIPRPTHGHFYPISSAFLMSFMSLLSKISPLPRYLCAHSASSPAAASTPQTAF
jgi:hypothetical protein